MTNVECNSGLVQLNLFEKESSAGNQFLRGELDAAKYIADNVLRLSRYQGAMVAGIIKQLQNPKKFAVAPGSNFVTQEFLHIFGDELLKHHATSRQPLSKDKFEFALEQACVHSGKLAFLSDVGNLAGSDITIDGERFSLKTESAKNTKLDELVISKFMELGRGRWDYDLQRSLFLDHLTRYDRILQFRCLQSGPRRYIYELVEVPRALLLEASRYGFEVVFERDPRARQTCDEESLRSAYCRVLDPRGEQKFALYFDGRGERKLSIKQLQKKYCFLHATWQFESDIF